MMIGQSSKIGDVSVNGMGERSKKVFNVLGVRFMIILVPRLVLPEPPLVVASMPHMPLGAGTLDRASREGAIAA